MEDRAKAHVARLSTDGAPALRDLADLLAPPGGAAGEAEAELLDFSRQ